MSFRVGATVLIDYNGNAIQSYAFETKRVLGCAAQVLKFLDSYGVDEIHMLIPIKKDSDIDTSKIFSDLMNISISTPLGIGGGINSNNFKKIIKNLYFERLIFNSAIFDDIDTLKLAKSIMGSQSMVACIPFIIRDDKIYVYHSRVNRFRGISNEFWDTVNSMFNEVILLNADSEGKKNGFDFKVFDLINFPVNRILISGGIVKTDIKKARKMNLAGVSIDNSTLHTEFSMEGFR
jgi:imidazole glycerol phosphate synthase subunit HisF